MGRAMTMRATMNERTMGERTTNGWKEGGSSTTTMYLVTREDGERPIVVAHFRDRVAAERYIAGLFWTDGALEGRYRVRRGRAA